MRWNSQTENFEAVFAMEQSFIIIYYIVSQIYWNIHVQKPAPHERPFWYPMYPAEVSGRRPHFQSHACGWTAAMGLGLLLDRLAKIDRLDLIRLD